MFVGIYRGIISSTRVSERRMANSFFSRPSTVCRGNSQFRPLRAPNSAGKLQEKQKAPREKKNLGKTTLKKEREETTHTQNRETRKTKNMRTPEKKKGKKKEQKKNDVRSGGSGGGDAGHQGGEDHGGVRQERLREVHPQRLA